MSKQQSFMPNDSEICNKSPNKKHKGKYEVWMSYIGNDFSDTKMIKPFCFHRYATRELAEQNIKAFERKYNILNNTSWNFELRVNDE